MENILYIDDYINLYNKNINKIIVYKPYKNTLNKGRIIDREKFIKLYSKLLKEYKLNNHIFGNSIKVIINNNINKEDINLIKIVLEELNYQNISFVKEIRYLNINSKSIYVCFNNNYFYLYYLDDFGNIIMLMYDYNKINLLLVSKVIKYLNKKEIYIFGKNYQELINILDKYKIDYYYYYDSDNLILKKIINDKLV